MEELKYKRERLLILETAYCYNPIYNKEKTKLKQEIKILKDDIKK